MSQSNDVVAEPRDREKALSVAYLRYLGATQTEAAEAAGVDRSTVQRWESCSWWAEIQVEAQSRWLAGLAGKARVGLERGVLTDPAISLRVLERLMPELAPGAIEFGPMKVVIERRVVEAKEELEK